MAWCRQATSHYLSQCWPRSMASYSVTRPQWVKGAFTFYTISWILFNRRPNLQWSNPTYCLSYSDNTMPADALVTLGARASAGMGLTPQSQNIPSPASEELRFDLQEARNMPFLPSHYHACCWLGKEPGHQQGWSCLTTYLHQNSSLYVIIAVHQFMYVFIFQGMRDRHNLSGSPELGLKNAITHRDNVDDYGNLIYEALKKVSGKTWKFSPLSC